MDQHETPQDPPELIDFFAELEERLSAAVRMELKLSALLVSIPGALDVYQTSLVAGYVAAREILRGAADQGKDWP